MDYGFSCTRLVPKEAFGEETGAGEMNRECPVHGLHGDWYACPDLPQSAREEIDASVSRFYGRPCHAELSDDKDYVILVELSA